MRLKLIACEMVYREVCWGAAHAKHPMDLEFLPQTYHDAPTFGREHLQARIDGVGRVDAVLVGYGLCHGLLVGLRASYVPLVIPRAGDCLSLCLGSQARREALVQNHPQACFYTAGWLENRGCGCTADATDDEGARSREEEGPGARQVWIDFPFTRHLDYEQRVQPLCPGRAGTYKTVLGDLGWLQRWLDGEWEETEFLIVQPGERVYATGDNRLIAAR
jgi:hypothetical protein